TVHGRVELAAALAEDWDFSAARFCGSPGHDQERLRDWLLGFDDPERDDVRGRDVLLQRMTEHQDTPDVLLLRLLRWLHPAAAPTYRHWALTPEALPELARQATAPPEPGNESRLVVLGLWQQRVLQILANAPRGGELGDADRQWRELHDQWRVQASSIA